MVFKKGQGITEKGFREVQNVTDGILHLLWEYTGSQEVLQVNEEVLNVHKRVSEGHFTGSMSL